MVIGENGVPFPETSVSLMQDGCSPPSGDYCEWMPYQREVAGKTEQLLRVQEAARKGFNS